MSDSDLSETAAAAARAAADPFAVPGAASESLGEPAADSAAAELAGAASDDAEQTSDDVSDVESDDEAPAAQEDAGDGADEADEADEASQAADVTAASASAAADSDVDEDEDPIEAFRERMRTAEGDWFVIHSYAGFEKRVKTNLESRIASMSMENFIFDIVVPMEDVTEIKKGERKLVTRTKFPGYVLVRMELTDESWGTVRHTPGVTGFVGHGHNPAPLSLDEVVAILAPVPEAKPGEPGKPGATAREVTVVDFSTGDAVTVIDGPFENLPASIAEINVDSQKVIVMVEIFGRETPVELGFHQIERT